MNQPNHNILNELKDLSPALAAIPRLNVFKVPEGYFETLPALLLLQASGSGKNEPIQSVPEGYFDNLASGIMARIREEAPAEAHSPVLAGIGNENIFSVPQGYFEGLAENIMSRIHMESANEVLAETYAISATVAGIGNKNVFTVPREYFNDLAGSVSSKLEKQPAKVVSMNSSRKFFRYAAAAAITGLIAMTTVFIINKNNAGGQTGVQVAAVKEAKQIIQNNSFDKEMASLSDADIVNFLESKGQDVDAALVASLTEDSKALPDADAYLLDENALDEVLQKLDLNN